MSDLNSIFNDLKAILEHHSNQLLLVTDKPGNYYLNTRKLDNKGKPIFFAMVKIAKAKVSYHLMPIYCHPELLGGISPELKKRMQGKSCFNFNKQEPILLEELNTLTQKGFETYQKNGSI